MIVNENEVNSNVRYVYNIVYIMCIIDFLLLSTNANICMKNTHVKCFVFQKLIQKRLEISATDEVLKQGAEEMRMKVPISVCSLYLHRAHVQGMK